MNRTRSGRSASWGAGAARVGLAVGVALLAVVSAVAAVSAQQGIQMAVTAGKREGTRAEIQSLERGSDGVVTLKFALVNDRAEGAPLGGDDFADPKHKTPDHNSVGGIVLLDPGSKTRFPVDRDASGKCVCSHDLAAIKAGSQKTAWAQFSGLPEDLTSVTIEIPGFEPAEGVPILHAAVALN